MAIARRCELGPPYLYGTPFACPPAAAGADLPGGIATRSLTPQARPAEPEHPESNQATDRQNRHQCPERLLIERHALPCLC